MLRVTLLSSSRLCAGAQTGTWQAARAMAGHSKWANTKHRKERQDLKKMKENSRLLRAVSSAYAMGSDVDSNPTLRIAIMNAKAGNVPNDRIKDAMKKKNDAAEEEILEIFGPEGVGVLATVLTDSKNRFLQELRPALDLNGGKMARAGTLLKNFARKGSLQLLVGDGKSAGAEEVQEEAMEVALEANAEGIQEAEGNCLLALYNSVNDASEAIPAFEASSFQLGQVQNIMVAESVVDLTPEGAARLQRLVEALEDLGDVVEVNHNGVWDEIGTLEDDE